MISERQRKFREQYNSTTSPLYSGWLHVGVIYGVGIAAIYYCVSQLQNARWEWLLTIPVFLAGNFTEWFMHRYVQHRRIDVYALRAVYDRHVHMHHHYFTDNEPTLDGVKAFRITFLPWRVMAVIGVVGTIFGYIASLIINQNAGYILFLTMCAQYLVYETMHCLAHVKENRFIRNIPFVNTSHRHHIAHHNMGIMMKYNFNSSFPITDWLMGTSDLRRGFLGHIFNGFSNRHVKEELKPIIERYRKDNSHVPKDGPKLSKEEEAIMQPRR